MNAAEPGWWQRNWRWAVPASVIGGLAGLAFFVGALVYFVLAVLKSSDAYAGALERARLSPAVVSALGEPVEPGWWVSGSLHVTGPSGTAEFMTPLRGPAGRGTLFVEAEKRAGLWRYMILEVEIDGTDERIALLPGRDGH